MLWALRIVALAGVCVGISGDGFFRFGHMGDFYLLGIWAPLPLAYGTSRYFAFGRLAMRIVLAGLLIALATSIWAYAWAVRVFLDGTGGLSGPMVLKTPLIQYAILVPFLLAGWIANRHAAANHRGD